MQFHRYPRAVLQASVMRPPTESRETRQRWHMLSWHHAHGNNVSLTARHFGVARTTVYRWLCRYDGRRLETLQSRSHRPQRVRRPMWSSDDLIAVERLRTKFPSWGKQKLRVLLLREGHQLSESTVGRILGALNARGALPEPLRRMRRRRRSFARSWAVRMPRDVPRSAPGDLLQLDTQDVCFDGATFKQFDFVDHVSRWSAIELSRRATARSAAAALDAALQQFPFPVRALQVDGGSEFMAEFELACQQRQLRLFVLPPRSPKLNGRAERIHRTHTEEFLDWYDGPNDPASTRAAFRAWQHTYNTVRPHRSLGLLTPQEFVARCPPQNPGASLVPV